VAWAAFRDTLLRMEGASGQVLIEVRSVKHRKQLCLMCVWLEKATLQNLCGTEIPARCADARAGCGAEHVFLELSCTGSGGGASTRAADGARQGLCCFITCRHTQAARSGAGGAGVGGWAADGGGPRPGAAKPERHRHRRPHRARRPQALLL